MAKFCTKCGNKIPDNCKFCTKCGNPIKNVPSSPKTIANNQQNVNNNKTNIKSSTTKSQSTVVSKPVVGKFSNFKLPILVAVLFICIFAGYFFIAKDEYEGKWARYSDYSNSISVYDIKKVSGNNYSLTETVYSYKSKGELITGIEKSKESQIISHRGILATVREKRFPFVVRKKLFFKLEKATNITEQYIKNEKGIFNRLSPKGYIYDKNRNALINVNQKNAVFEKLTDEKFNSLVKRMRETNAKNRKVGNISTDMLSLGPQALVVLEAEYTDLNGKTDVVKSNNKLAPNTEKFPPLTSDLSTFKSFIIKAGDLGVDRHPDTSELDMNDYYYRALVNTMRFAYSKDEQIGAMILFESNTAFDIKNLQWLLPGNCSLVKYSNFLKKDAQVNYDNDTICTSAEFAAYSCDKLKGYVPKSSTNSKMLKSIFKDNVPDILVLQTFVKNGRNKYYRLIVTSPKLMPSLCSDFNFSKVPSKYLEKNKKAMTEDPLKEYLN